MHECVKRLLSQRDEESLECLCKLFATRGEELDDPKDEGSKERMDDYLTQMQKIADERSTSSRIRFMLQDVIDSKKAHIQKSNEVDRKVQMPEMPVIPNFRDHFLPTFAQRGVPRMPQMNNFANRRSLQGRDSKTKKVISLSQNVKLHEADNPWKPLYKQDVGGDQLEIEKDKLKRSVQGILNKLTPQKFETLLTQAKHLNIDTEEKLCIVCDLIFENAVKMPKFSVPFANMSKHLALIKVPSKHKDFVNFRKILLTRCQMEFEKKSNHGEKSLALEEATKQKKQELEQVVDEEEKKMRYRQLGNIRFIGELFKLGMLTEPIMHECIKMLLSQGDEQSLECLGKLLKTIGKKLDDRKVKGSGEMMGDYFKQIQKIVDERLISPRVRFLLQDVIDLKKNNWVPRKEENEPTTIDKIHGRKALCGAIYQRFPNLPFQKKAPDDRYRRRNTALNIGTSEDIWASSTKCSKDSYSLVDPNKLKLTKPDKVDSIRLGPGRAMQSWRRRSSGDTKTPAGSFDAEKTALTNKYAASSREPSTAEESGHVIEAVEGLVRSDTSSETKAAETENNPEPQISEIMLKGPEYNINLMEVKARPLVDEFLHNNDFEKLEFTFRPTKEKSTTPKLNEEIKEKLLDLLGKTDESKEIFYWIDANVSERTEPNFIRALVCAVHENAIKNTSSGCELDVTKLKKRISILTRYIDHNENLELQALYAIQSLTNQLNQPKGILRQIFDILYDDDVITEESFKNWEQSNDINEVEGKGVALDSVKSFFTWLKETDSGD